MKTRWILEFLIDYIPCYKDHQLETIFILFFLLLVLYILGIWIAITNED